MTKAQFLEMVAALYAVGNVSDSHDNPRREAWTRPAMAGEACCAALDSMLREMVKCGALTQEESQAFYDGAY